MTESVRMVIRHCAGIDRFVSALECGCCGTRYVPRRVRMWLVAGDLPHGEICAECILRGPWGAAERLRERIGQREGVRLGRRKEKPPGGWSGWMTARARLLETMECFPLSVRQAAVREMRESR